MKNLKFLQAVLMNVLIGVLAAFVFGFNPIVGALVVNIAGIAMAETKKRTGLVFWDGLAQEVWLADILQNFYPDNHFLSAVKDYSSLVDNHAINLAEVGADPDVLVNNAVWPIPYAVAGDSPLQVILKTYDTTSTVVRNAIAIEQAYDQRAIYVGKHQKALLKKFGMDASWMYGPVATDAAKNNIVTKLAALDSVIDAVIDMQRQFNNMDAPGDRVVVFSPDHMANIAKEDKKLYKAIMAEPGSVFYGFKVYTYSKNPLYIAANSTKAAFGVAYDPMVHLQSSLFFLADEVMKAQGTFEFFSILKHPDYKGDIFNYQMRGIAMPLRDKHRGAIIQ